MALKVGETAPEFSLFDATKQLRSLSEFRGKNVVLAFYPAAFTGVCSKEVCTFRDSIEELGALHATVIAISVDPPFSNRAFAEKYNVNFPLLSDFTRYVSSQYCGLMMDFSGVGGYTAAKRSVFVLDSEGIVRYTWISENPGVEPNYDDIRMILSSL